MRRSESSYNTVDVLFSWFFWATIIAVALWLLPILDRPDPPTTDQNSHNSPVVSPSSSLADYPWVLRYYLGVFLY